jgi:hypothetical protein
MKSKKQENILTSIKIERRSERTAHVELWDIDGIDQNEKQTGTIGHLAIFYDPTDAVKVSLCGCIDYEYDVSKIDIEKFIYDAVFWKMGGISIYIHSFYYKAGNLNGYHWE